MLMDIIRYVRTNRGRLTFIGEGVKRIFRFERAEVPVNGEQVFREEMSAL